MTPTEKTVMIVGAGETAELALKSLVEKGVREVLVRRQRERECRAGSRTDQPCGRIAGEDRDPQARKFAGGERAQSAAGGEA